MDAPVQRNTTEHRTLTSQQSIARIRGSVQMQLWRTEMMCLGSLIHEAAAMVSTLHSGTGR